MSLGEIMKALEELRNAGVPLDALVFADPQTGELFIPERVVVDADGDVRMVVL